MKNIKKLLIAFIAMQFIALKAFAVTEKDLHHVEVLVFANKTKEYIEAEDLNDSYTELNTDKATIIKPRYAFEQTKEVESASFDDMEILNNKNSKDLVASNKIENSGLISEPAYIKKSDWLMVDIASKLLKDKTKKVIYHTAWQQALENSKRTKPVLLGEGEFDLDHSERYNNNSNFAGLMSIKKVNRFFHIKTNFLFANDSTAAKIFKIKADGRTKFKELYYFDHPAFGALVLIDKI